MSKIKCLNFNRKEGSVFVAPAELPDSVKIQQRAGQYFQDWTGVVKDIVNETPLRPAEPTPEPIPEPIREHRARLTEDTIYAVMAEMDRRWLKPSEILSVATTQFRIEAEPKALKKVLHSLFMNGRIKDKQVGPQTWYRYLAVNWRLQNSITVNMNKLQRLNDWHTASRIKDEMYDKYNRLTVEYVETALDTLAETDARMLVEVVDGERRYHWKVESAPAPEQPKAEMQGLLAEVDALLGVR